MIHPLCVVLFLFTLLSGNSSANLEDESTKNHLISTLTASKSALISEVVQDNYTFHGLASYYSNVYYYIIEDNNLSKINSSEVKKLSQNQWLAVVGRFNVLLIKSKGISIYLNESKLIIENARIMENPDAVIKVVAKPDLSLIAPELDQIRYAHLWVPLAWLAKGVESSLVTIHAHIVNNWGFTLVIFSMLLKLLLLPVGMMTVHFQRKVSQVRLQLVPQLAVIKANYDGEEAHNRLMAAHKNLGVSPFYSLKPILGSFIQIPILIAVFNALGEMPQFVGQSFLWIDNLAYPDVIGHIDFSIPMFGDTVSLLPIVMTLITIYSTMIFQNRHASEVDIKRQKRNLYLMAAAFFVLFYPFPAVMVLYWTLANILHTIQQQIIKI